MNGPLQIATIVDWEALADTAIAALAGGIALTLTFSLAIYGMTRATEYRFDDKPAQAFVAALLGGLALLAAVATVALGLVVMIS